MNLIFGGIGIGAMIFAFYFGYYITGIVALVVGAMNIHKGWKWSEETEYPAFGGF